MKSTASRAPRPASRSVSPEFIALQQAVAGRYSLDRELGRGGMGVVFLARDVALERLVAIKLLPPALVRVPGARERFLREARLAARLSHPHIVPIHAVEQHEELAFFAMAYVDGETLGDRVRRAGPLPPATLARVLREVAWALAHAHAHGVVHRDVKPENVLLERGSESGVGRALVSDFGIALPASEATVSAGRGTPAFMSPEQAAAAPVDARSDIYSLGVTAWVAATGALPWANDGARLLAWEGRATVPRLGAVAPKVPAPLAAAIERCLAADPAQRWESADALAGALAEQQAVAVSLPLPLRRWVREAGDVGLDVVTSAAGVVSALAVMGIGTVMGGNIDDIVARVLFGAVAAVFGAFGVGRLAQLSGAARELQRAGFGEDAARTALLVDEQQRIDEWIAPRWARGDTLALLVSLASMVAGTWLIQHAENAMTGMGGVALAVVAPTVLGRQVAGRRGRVERLWRRVVDGRVGRWIFRLGRIGMKAPVSATPWAGEPTALAVGRAVDQLWAQLPDGDRQLLGDVPALVQKLEARALALRGGGDVDPARAERLAETVATLEAVRLDLLRLRARQLEASGMTTTLAQAERVAAYVDEVLTPI